MGGACHRPNGVCICRIETEPAHGRAGSVDLGHVI
jgi:hypothetical protein